MERHRPTGYYDDYEYPRKKSLYEIERDAQYKREREWLDNLPLRVLQDVERARTAGIKVYVNSPNPGRTIANFVYESIYNGRKVETVFISRPGHSTTEGRYQIITGMIDMAEKEKSVREALGRIYLNILNSEQALPKEDTMTSDRNKKYEYFIYDGARDLAVMHGQDVQGLRNALHCKGVIDFNALDIVARNQTAPDYELENYRGKMCDLGVIEAVKDCLRPVYGF